jgi:hypothetical protein
VSGDVTCINHSFLKDDMYYGQGELSFVGILVRYWGGRWGSRQHPSFPLP